jgi:uncharacterized protein (TIGR02271 family)
MPQTKKTKTSTKGKDPNPDPITGEPGAHPVGVGVGTAAGGAAAGALGGAVAGPVGVVVGAVAGGIAGALAGKSVAETIDPTEEDAYWRENFHTRPYVKKDASYDMYRPAYLYGVTVHKKHGGRPFDEVEADLSKGWPKARGKSPLPWNKVREAVRDAYDRTIRLHEEQLHPRKEQVQTGEVRLRKDVVSERQTLEVPVEREEVVIHRRPASRRAAAGDIRAEEVRIPVRKEKIHPEKKTVVKEEVRVGKRAVQDTERVSDTVRKERLRVDERGKVRVRGKTGRGAK